MFHSAEPPNTSLSLNQEHHILGHHHLVSILHRLQGNLHLRSRELGVGVRVHLVHQLLDGQTLGVGGRESPGHE